MTPKEKKITKPLLYGEETKVVSFRVPISKKTEVKTFVENLLKTYLIKK